MRVGVAEVDVEDRPRRCRRPAGSDRRRAAAAGRPTAAGCCRSAFGVGVSAVRLQERRVLRLRRRGAAGREVPEDADAAADDRLAVAGDVVGEAEARPEVALRVGLQVAADLDAVDRRVVRGDHELARSTRRSSTAGCPSRPTARRCPSAGPRLRVSLAVHAEVVLQVERRTPAASRCRCRRRTGCGSCVARVAEQEAGDVEAGVRCRRVQPRRVPAQFDVRLLVEAEAARRSCRRSGSRASGSVQLPPGLERVLAADLGDVVEDLEVVLVRDERLVAVGAQVADVLEGDLGHRRGRRR